MKVTDQEWGVISNALRVAADKYREDAVKLQKYYGNTAPPAIKRFAELFGRQEYDARHLYDRIIGRGLEI